MPRKVLPIVLLLCVVMRASPALAQVDTPVAGLDAFWAELGRSIMEGDIDGMRGVYHPDAVGLYWQGDTYSMGLMTEANDAQAGYFLETRNGARTIDIQWRFVKRVHDANAAHEIAIARFIETPAGGTARTSYGHIEAFLVNRGKWLSLVSNVRWNATEAEWNAAAPRN